jgi:putative ABC transport system permease protein
MTSYAESIAEDTAFEYMYVLSNPLDEVPDGAEKSFTVSLSMYCDMAGGELPVVIQGVEKDSRFFDFAGKLSDKKNLIYASDSAIIKYGCGEGDKLIFTDSLNKKDYVLTVAGEVSFKNGIFFFMDIDSMRRFFGVPEDYYNTLLSDTELDIDRDMLISRTTKKSIVETAESWVNDTKGTIGMFLVMSVAIFVLVTCILVKNMLERSVYQISLLKLIGYRTGELNRVYLNNTALTMLLAVIFAFPAGTRLMDYLIPVMNGSMKSGMANHIMPSSYIIMTGIIAVSYLAAYLMMQRRLAKIEANEVLKDSE